MRAGSLTVQTILAEAERARERKLPGAGAVVLVRHAPEPCRGGRVGPPAQVQDVAEVGARALGVPEVADARGEDEHVLGGHPVSTQGGEGARDTLRLLDVDGEADAPAQRSEGLLQGRHLGCGDRSGLGSWLTTSVPSDARRTSNST